MEHVARILTEAAGGAAAGGGDPAGGNQTEILGGEGALNATVTNSTLGAADPAAAPTPWW